MTFQEKKIFVTGGTGMLGQSLLVSLIAKGYQVRASFRSSHPSTPGVEWVEADILDVVALEDAMKDIDVVFHCAALVSYDPSQKRNIFKINVEGTANVINAALDEGVKQFIYVSSVAAIGGQEDVLITEDAIWDENANHSDYSISKHEAEMEVRRGEIEGLEIAIVNPSIILGSGDWNKGSTELFSKIYNRFPYYTQGIHGFVDVEDVVLVLIHLLENASLNGRRFILNGDNISYKYLFDLIAKAFQIPPPHRKVTPLKAGIVWRLSYLKGKLTGKPSMLTKKSAHLAQANIQYDGSQLLKAIPDFEFRPISETVNRICKELKSKYNLA